MSVKIASYVIAAVALVSIVATVRFVRRGRMQPVISLLWIGVWVSVAVFAIFPQLLDHVMGLLTMGNRMFFVTTSAIVVLLVLVFHLSSRVAHLERRLTRVIQAVALAEFDLRELIAATESESRPAAPVRPNPSEEEDAPH